MFFIKIVLFFCQFLEYNLISIGLEVLKMEKESQRNHLIDDFLIQLEYLALSTEEEITFLENENEDYKYITDLVEVLTVSKSSFVECYMSLSKEKTEEFKSIIGKVISCPEKLSSIINEIRNLYYLLENNLQETEEALSQRETSEETIDNFKNSLLSYTRKIDYQENNSKIKQLKEYIENIVTLGTNLEEENEIKNIDFLQEILDNINLSTQEQQEILMVIIKNNLKIYQNPKQASVDQIATYVPNSEIKEAIYSRNDENIEEILDEMLGNELTSKVDLPSLKRI